MFFWLYIAVISAFAKPIQRDLQTQDGAWVTTYRYENSGPVVLLAQGITSNYKVWDLTSTISLSQYLHKLGFDVWMRDFRGDRYQTTRNKKNEDREDEDREDEEGETRKREPRKLRQGSPFVFGYYDLARVIDHINLVRPTQKIHLIAYSFSGLSFVHYAHHHSTEKLGKLVFLATPGDFQSPEPLWIVMSKVLSVIPFSIKTNQLAPFVSRVSRLPLRMEQIIWNEANMDAKTRHYLLNNIFRPISRKEMKELIMIVRDETYPNPQKYDYTLSEVLQKVHNPSLVISGRLDQIASVDRVQKYYEYLGSSNKKLIIAGKMYGYKADYGHACLVMSPIAIQEIYPQIGFFLEQEE